MYQPLNSVKCYGIWEIYKICVLITIFVKVITFELWQSIMVFLAKAENKFNEYISYIMLLYIFFEIVVKWQL